MPTSVCNVSVSARMIGQLGKSCQNISFNDALSRCSCIVQSIRLPMKRIGVPLAAYPARRPPNSFRPGQQPTWQNQRAHRANWSNGWTRAMTN